MESRPEREAMMQSCLVQARGLSKAGGFEVRED